MPARLIAVWLLAGVLGLLLAAAAAAATSVTPTVIPSGDGPEGGPMRLADGSEQWQPGFGVERDPVVRLVFWGPAWEHDSTGGVSRRCFASCPTALGRRARAVRGPRRRASRRRADRFSPAAPHAADSS
jgi:hypothetical protein